MKVPDLPRRSRLRRLLRGLLIAIGTYLGFVLVLALLQRSMIYFPDRAAAIQPEEADLPPGRVHTIAMRSDDGLELRGWHVLPNGRRADDPDGCDRELASGGWVMLYFSGNGGNRTYRSDEFSVLTRLGCHVFLFDYRGYGENAGSPTEERLAADALSAWRYAVDQRQVPPSRILLYGESLGGGVATRLAADRCLAGEPPAGLILRSTFSSLADAGAYHYPWLPVRLVLIDRFDSVRRIGAVTSPLLQIHGTRDTIVPLRLAHRLHAAAPERSASGQAKRLVELRGADHNDVTFVAEDELQQAIAEFLRAL